MAAAEGKLDDALKLYGNQARLPGDEGFRARNAEIRLQLIKLDIPAAEKAARNWLAADPKNAWAQDAVADVDFRAGAIDKAGEEFRGSIAVNFCNPQIHADYARYLAFSGYHASAKAQLGIAHKLDAVDEEIGEEWSRYQPRAVRAASLSAFLQHATLDAAQRKELTRQRDDLQGPPLYPCTLVSPMASATIPFHAIRNGSATNGTHSNVEWGLAVTLNNSVRRLEIDSGAHGIILTRAAAASLGLKIDRHEEITGVDPRATPISIATVQDIKIDHLEFKDCAVQILEQDVIMQRWDANVSMMEGQDGLIGSDVFKDFLVTLDFPGKAMKLDPLPPVPNAAPAPAASMDTGVASASVPPLDRYIAPSMSSWTKVFRTGHELFVPVRVNNGPVDLFLVDTGAGLEDITPAAAKAVGKLERGSGDDVVGVSGEVKHVGFTGALTLDFGGLRQPVPSLDSFSLDHLGAPAEISGILGQYTLHQLTIQIDYRDQLMKFTYNPGRVAHCVDRATIDDCYE
jgi:hypothetical protein